MSEHPRLGFNHVSQERLNAFLGENTEQSAMAIAATIQELASDLGQLYALFVGICDERTAMARYIQTITITTPYEQHAFLVAHRRLMEAQAIVNATGGKVLDGDASVAEADKKGFARDVMAQALAKAKGGAS